MSSMPKILTLNGGFCIEECVCGCKSVCQSAQHTVVVLLRLLQSPSSHFSPSAAGQFIDRLLLGQRFPRFCGSSEIQQLVTHRNLSQLIAHPKC